MTLAPAGGRLRVRGKCLPGPRFVSGKATKFCGEDGRWFRHPETNRTWTNYTLCASTQEKRLKVTPRAAPGASDYSDSRLRFCRFFFSRLQKLKLLENEYKCLLKMSREAPGNKSGLFWTPEGSCWCDVFLKLCRCCRLPLQPQLGRLVVLGRHPSGDPRLSKLP